MAPDRNALGEVHDPFADDVPERQIDAPPARTMMEVAQRMSGGAPATPRGSAIVPADNNNVRVGSFTLTPVGLTVVGIVTEREWEQFYASLQRVKKSMQWAIADWANYGAQRWGKKYDELVTLTKLKEKSLREYSYVARSVQLSIRMDKLSFAHHQLVANLPPEKQSASLKVAFDSKMTVAQFRAYLEGRELEKVTSVSRFQERLVKLYSQTRKRKHAERREMALLLRQMADALEAETPPGTEDTADA